MCISSYSVAFAAHNHKDFCVDFKVYKSVDYGNAGIFKFICPGDVSFFVKARLKFNKHDDLFSVACGAFQCADNRRVASCTVKRHFDCKDILVVRRIGDEFYYRVIRFVRNVQKDVVLFENVPVRFILRQICRVKMLPFRKTHFCPFVSISQFHQHGRVY